MVVWPPMALQPLSDRLERKFAHSDRLVLPRITAPPSVSRRTRGASRPVTLSLSAREPAVVAVSSALSMLSFSRIGTPCRGPRRWPAVRSASSLRASAKAWGFRVMTARCGPSDVWIRSRAPDTKRSLRGDPRPPSTGFLGITVPSVGCVAAVAGDTISIDSAAAPRIRVCRMSPSRPGRANCLARSGPAVRPSRAAPGPWRARLRAGVTLRRAPGRSPSSRTPPATLPRRARGDRAAA